MLTEADGTEERIEFDEVYQVNWTETSLFIAGSLVENEGIPPVDATREYEIEDLSAVLTRQIDAGRSSIIIGALIVGAIAALTLYFNGQTDEGTVIPLGGGA